MVAHPNNQPHSSIFTDIEGRDWISSAVKSQARERTGAMPMDLRRPVSVLRVSQRTSLLLASAALSPSGTCVYIHTPLGCGSTSSPKQPKRPRAHLHPVQLGSPNNQDAIEHASAAAALRVRQSGQGGVQLRTRG